MQKTQGWSLGQEDLLEKEMATHSSILAWRIPWTEEPGGLHSPWGRKELGMTEWLNWAELNLLYIKYREVIKGSEITDHPNEQR